MLLKIHFFKNLCVVCDFVTAYFLCWSGGWGWEFVEFSAIAIMSLKGTGGFCPMSRQVCCVPFCPLCCCISVVRNFASTWKTWKNNLQISSLIEWEHHIPLNSILWYLRGSPLYLAVLVSAIPRQTSMRHSVTGSTELFYITFKNIKFLQILNWQEFSQLFRPYRWLLHCKCAAWVVAAQKACSPLSIGLM